MNSYKVTIGRKAYELPARTLSVDEAIEAVGKLAKQYDAGELTRRQVVQAQYDFVESLAPGAMPPVDEVDTNELLRACVDIINAYNAPALEAQAEAQAAKIRSLVGKPEFQKALNMAKMAEAVKK